jgi:hypothetical protein
VPKLTFPFNKHPIEGVPSRQFGGIIPPLPELTDNTYYYFDSTNPNPPAPITSNGWVATTKMNDVGANDQTTYEMAGEGKYLHVILFRTPAKTFQSWTATIYAGDTPTVTIKYWDGSFWQAYDTPVVAGTPGWQNILGNPTDQSSKAVCITVLDSVESRVGDYRLVQA